MSLTQTFEPVLYKGKQTLCSIVDGEQWNHAATATAVFLHGEVIDQSPEHIVVKLPEEHPPFCSLSVYLADRAIAPRVVERIREVL